ncbi:PIN domain-containing protein [Methylomagnum sp.]
MSKPAPGHAPCWTIQKEVSRSDFVRLGVLPKPGFHRKTKETAFMEIIFEAAEDVPITPALVRRALALATRYDAAPLDALHLAATEAANAELITLEGPDKPMCRQTEVPVISLRVLLMGGWS